MLKINWGKDKVGFINAFVLIGIVAVTLIATIALIVLGFLAGDWSRYILALKFVLGGAYILCTIAVLTRIGVYRSGVVKRKAQEEKDRLSREQGEQEIKEGSA